MSIALSFVLHPSRKLQILAITFSIVLLLVGVFTACTIALPFYLRLVLASTFALSALGSCWYVKAVLNRRWYISIDGQGEFYCHLIASQEKFPVSDAPLSSDACRLSASTVLWSKILFLRLQRLKDDNMINLVILSDAVSGAEFRRLSIACRWVVAQVKRK